MQDTNPMIILAFLFLVKKLKIEIPRNTVGMTIHWLLFIPLSPGGPSFYPLLHTLFSLSLFAYGGVWSCIDRIYIICSAITKKKKKTNEETKQKKKPKHSCYLKGQMRASLIAQCLWVKISH